MHIAHIEPRAMSALPAIAGAAVVAGASMLPALCPFRLWSGHACPLCGMTRAVRSLATGDLSTAVQYHPLVLLIALEAALIALFYARTQRRPAGRVMSRLVGANAVAFAVVWLVRWRLGLLSFVVS